MPRKLQSEKVNEASVERPATRRSVRLSASSPNVTPEQKRSASSRSPKGSASASTSRTIASPKSSGKKGAETKVSTPSTASRGRSKGSREPEDTDKTTAEKEEQSRGDEAATEQKGKQFTRKGRGGVVKEKAEVVETEVKDKISPSEESQNPSLATGRPKRGGMSVAAAVTNKKPTATSKRSGKSPGKAAAAAEKTTDSSECTLEAESSPAKGAKRKREEEADETVEEGNEELVAETGSPKKSKNVEPTKEEVEKMEVETVDAADIKGSEASKEEKATESVAITEQEESKEGVVCMASDPCGNVDESKSTGEKFGSEEELLISSAAASTSEEPATSDVQENGSTKETNKVTTSLNLPLNRPESEVVTVGDSTTEKASSSQKMEETLPNGTDDSTGNDALLARKFIWYKGEEASPSNLAQTFSIVSYNILADYHAQRDFTGLHSWITKEHLAVDYRHSLLMKEILFLDSDILCLQEVPTDYFLSTLKPALAALGYDGLHVQRHNTDWGEGEATFFRTKCFSLEASQSLILSRVAEREIDESAIESEVKSSVKAAVDSYAVSLLTRLKHVDSDATITCANIHVAYDTFLRQDKQCLQLACAIRELVKLAGGPDKPHLICGDFNSWPDSPPYQLVQDGHLSEKSLTALQSINSVSQADGQLAPLVNYWSEGFQYPPSNNLQSAYLKAVGKEPLSSRFNFDGIVRSVDYIWFSSNSIEVMGVLETVDADKIKDGVPNAIFPSDHLSLKAVLGFK